MTRTRALVAAGLLLALGMFAAVACGGGSSGGSKTATPRVTGTASPPSATGTVSPSDTPAATQPSGTPGLDATGAPTPTFPPPATPPAAFSRTAASHAREFLSDVLGQLRAVDNGRRTLGRDIPYNPLQPTPTLVPPVRKTWFAECCQSDLNGMLHDIDRTETYAGRLSAAYADAGHTQGQALADQITPQLEQLKTLLQAVASATEPRLGAEAFDAVSPAINAIEHTIAAIGSCCLVAYAAN